VSEEVPTPGIISVLRSTTRMMIHELLDALDNAGYPDMQAAFHPLFECIDDEGTRLTELAARADMTHQSMGEIVVSLEQRGYVERRPDPADGRARLVCLTPAGRKLRRVGTEKIRDIERLWQARWREAGLDVDVRTAFWTALGSTRR
jgi:DNA-binding MarR family transcriptional regulator